MESDRVAGDATRPAWLPERFASVEEWHAESLPPGFASEADARAAGYGVPPPADVLALLPVEGRAIAATTSYRRGTSRSPGRGSQRRTGRRARSPGRSSDDDSGPAAAALRRAAPTSRPLADHLQQAFASANALAAENLRARLPARPDTPGRRRDRALLALLRGDADHFLRVFAGAPGENELAERIRLATLGVEPPLDAVTAAAARFDRKRPWSEFSAFAETLVEPYFLTVDLLARREPLRHELRDIPAGELYLLFRAYEVERGWAIGGGDYRDVERVRLRIRRRAAKSCRNKPDRVRRWPR